MMILDQTDLETIVDIAQWFAQLDHALAARVAQIGGDEAALARQRTLVASFLRAAVDELGVRDLVVSEDEPADVTRDLARALLDRQLKKETPQHGT